MFQLAENRQETGKELRSCVVETLQELMREDDKVTALEADLGGASGFTKIKETNPNRFIQCGIAEANMIGVAAGLSVTSHLCILLHHLQQEEYLISYFYLVRMQEIRSIFMDQIPDLALHPMEELIHHGKMSH